MSECPSCGRTDFKSDRGMRQHHARTHGESLTTKLLTCEWCGADYELIRSKAENSRFCSNDCKLDAFHEMNRGQDTTTVSCQNCGDDVERRPHQLEKTQGHFCDHQCHGEWLSGENHHEWNGGDVTVACDVCGTEIERNSYWATNNDRNFCSDDCHYHWISENLRGEDHPQWKGGVSHEYPGGWRDARKKALERDSYQCRACGITMEEHREQRGSSLDVHHIVPVRRFDDPRDAHSIGNLVTACRSCHTKYEGHPVFPF